MDVRGAEREGNCCDRSAASSDQATGREIEMIIGVHHKCNIQETVLIVGIYSHANADYVTALLRYS